MGDMSPADQMAAFIAAGNATVCRPARARATSLRRLRDERETALAAEVVSDDTEVRSREAFAEARAAGFSESEALDFASA